MKAKEARLREKVAVQRREIAAQLAAQRSQEVAARTAQKDARVEALQEKKASLKRVRARRNFPLAFGLPGCMWGQRWALPGACLPGHGKV